MKKFLVSITLALALLTATLAQTSPTGSPNQSNEKVVWLSQSGLQRAVVVRIGL
jgi:hypothetical protein